VELVSLHPVPVEEFSRFKALSRVVLADNLSIVGGGVVREMKTLRTRLIVGIGGMLDEKTDFKTRWFGSFLIEFDIQIVSSFWEFFVVSVVLVRTIICRFVFVSLTPGFRVGFLFRQGRYLWVALANPWS
jgi:hypothetical protein